ncbi:unnamed protein product [Paramecium sonneborni]|uniref:CHAT domain-containing protein n=1 Tax=Paramecium sonneborni TaxID=65129 RepID=A0A8S1QYN3_9CILI|nr:unnamed protein product [Paramecium sonneborni]
MKNPIVVQLIFLGIIPNDEEEFFENPEVFLKTNFEKNGYDFFPLQKKQNNQGINVKRLKNYIEKKKEIKEIEEVSELIIMFYDYLINQFIQISNLSDNNGFIMLESNGQFFYNHKCYCLPLIIKLKMKIYYHEFQNKQMEQFKQIQKLQEIQQNYQKQLEEIKEKYSEYKKGKKYPHGQIDIAILYSNPILKNKNNPYDSVDYYDEIEEFKKAGDKLNVKVRYLITQANLQNLKDVLSCNPTPKIIHITCHGENDESNQHLGFEGNGLLQELHTLKFSEQFEKQNGLKLILLSCCHGQAFADQTQKYAITIAVKTQELKMEEEASKNYFSSLYEHLLKNKTIRESHECAKKFVKDQLKDKNNQCCCSHSHHNCLFQNKDQKKYCFFCERKQSCQCKSELIKDKIQHLSGCKIIDALKVHLKNEQQKKALHKLLENKEIIRACCCELSKQLNGENDEIYEIEHTESEKFQIFRGKNDDEQKVFEDIQLGKLDEICQKDWKFKWDEKLFICCKQQAFKIYQWLEKQFAQMNQINQITQITHNQKIDYFVVEFAKQVALYFQYRYLKFSEHNKFKNIEIIEKQFERIQELPNKQFEKEVGYIFIIYEINNELTQENLNLLQDLQGKVILILKSSLKLTKVHLKHLKEELTKVNFKDNGLFKKIKKRYDEKIVDLNGKKIAINSLSIEEFENLFIQ